MRINAPEDGDGGSALPGFQEISAQRQIGAVAQGAHLRLGAHHRSDPVQHGQALTDLAVGNQRHAQIVVTGPGFEVVPAADLPQQCGSLAQAPLCDQDARLQILPFDQPGGLGARRAIAERVPGAGPVAALVVAFRQAPPGVIQRIRVGPIGAGLQQQCLRLAERAVVNQAIGQIEEEVRGQGIRPALVAQLPKLHGCREVLLRTEQKPRIAHHRVIRSAGGVARCRGSSRTLESGEEPRQERRPGTRNLHRHQPESRGGKPACAIRQQFKHRGSRLRIVARLGDEGSRLRPGLIGRVAGRNRHTDSMGSALYAEPRQTIQPLLRKRLRFKRCEGVARENFPIDRQACRDEAEPCGKGSDLDRQHLAAQSEQFLLDVERLHLDVECGSLQRLRIVVDVRGRHRRMRAQQTQADCQDLARAKLNHRSRRRQIGPSQHV